MKIMKNKLMKKRITEMLDKENLTTGQIKDRLNNATTSKGTRAKKGLPTSNQLQMILRQNYRKVSFCSKAKQVVWGNK